MNYGDTLRLFWNPQANTYKDKRTLKELILNKLSFIGNKNILLSCVLTTFTAGIIHTAIISVAPEGSRDDTEDQKGFITHFCHGPKRHLLGLMHFAVEVIWEITSLCPSENSINCSVKFTSKSCISPSVGKCWNGTLTDSFVMTIGNEMEELRRSRLAPWPLHNHTGKYQTQLSFPPFQVKIKKKKQKPNIVKA